MPAEPNKILDTESSVDTNTFQQEKMYNKILELGKKVENIEKNIIDAVKNEEQEKNSSVAQEYDISQEIEEILEDCTKKIQNRYKSVGDLEIEQIQNLILIIIKTQMKNVAADLSLVSAVQKDVQAKIETLDSLEHKQDTLKKACANEDYLKSLSFMTEMKNTLKKAFVSVSNRIGLLKTITGIAKTEIEEVIKLLDSEEDKNKLLSLTDEQKSNLLINYKTIDFLKFQALVYDVFERKFENNTPKIIESLSEELKPNINQNFENVIKVEDHNSELCTTKIKELFHELEMLEKKFDNIALSYLVIPIVEGLERFWPTNLNRYTFYDQILEKLTSYLIPNSTEEQPNNINDLKSDLEYLQEMTLFELWKNFFKKQKIKNLDDTNWYRILDILEDYCMSEDEDADFDMEQFEYFMIHLVKLNKLSSQDIYKTINNINSQVLKTTDNKKTRVNSLKAISIMEADQMELENINALFENRINYQKEQSRKLLEIKNFVVKEYQKFSGIIDKSNTENYTKIVKLYLDKLDRLVAERHAEDLSYSKRNEVFNKLKKNIIIITTKQDINDIKKADFIEYEIAKELNQLIFDISSTTDRCLSDDILEHLNKMLNNAWEIQNDYKRKTKTMQIIELQDLFDNDGKTKEHLKKELISRNKTVVVNIDQEEYYRLSEDLHALKLNSSAYNHSIEEFLNTLANLFKIYKLSQLKKAIKSFETSKNLKNFMDITKGLIYYLSLNTEHFGADKSFEHSLYLFINNYHNVVKYLMINDKSDQTIISEIRIALDLFIQDVIHQRRETIMNTENISEIKEINELESILKSLRETLTYKTYKEVGFGLFTEVEIQYKQSLSLNNLFSEKLQKIIEEQIPEILWLRSISIPKHSEEFYKSLNEIFTKNISTKLEDTTLENIYCIQNFIKEERNKIMLDGLLEEEAIDSVDDFIGKIKAKKLNWNIVLSNQDNLSDVHKFQKLSLILQEHQSKFSKEDIEDLLTAIEKKNTGLDGVLKFILKLYAYKTLEDKEISLEEVNQDNRVLYENLELLKTAINTAFDIWDIDQNRLRKVNIQYFVRHIKQLGNGLPETLNSADEKIKNILESVNLKFIVNVLGISESEDLTSTKIFKKFDVLQNDKDKITYLTLLLHIPNSFYSNHADYKAFVAKLLKGVPEENNVEFNDLQSTLYFYIREHVDRYYNLFLNKIVDVNETKNHINLDVKEALQRLYDNLSVIDYLKYARKWLTSETEDKQSNFIIKTLQSSYEKDKERNIGYILPLLYIEEKKHLKALLSTKVSENEAAEDEATEDDIGEILNTKIMELLQSSVEQPKTMITNELNNMFSKDTVPPIIMWTDEFIQFRLNEFKDIVFGNINDQDHGTTKFDDILNAFRFFHDEKGNLLKALDTLNLICQNIHKFSTLEEVKQLVYSLLHVEDFKVINHIIQTSDKQTITVDWLFSQISVENDWELKNALNKLQLILSNRKFSEIHYFCKLFILQLRDQPNLDNIPTVIELVLESKAYKDLSLLKQLENKDMFLWSGVLRKQIIFNELNNTVFGIYSSKEKNKIVELLYQIKGEKGKEYLENLFEKIKNLDKTDVSSSNIRKLSFILKKIIHKPLASSGIEKLTQNMSEWEEILFNKTDLLGEETLSIKKLFEIMNEEKKISSEGINASIKSCLNSKVEGKSDTLMENLLTRARNLEKLSKIYETTKHINEWQEQDICEWAKSFKKKFSNEEILLWNNSTKPIETITEIISVIIQAVIVYDHYPKGPRDTQLISLLLFLDSSNTKGRLANIYTGEGKTLITVMLATCLGLVGKRVDVVTSSKVLAIRDSNTRESGSNEGYRGFFEMFGLKCSNNCDEECENVNTGQLERKLRYENCSIIYGEAAFFQRDILLTQFFGKDIRTGSGIGDVLILDEVDSMMIDNAAKTLYISHNITDMRYLKDVFIHIWAAVNTREERYYSDENVQKIMKYINQLIDNGKQFQNDGFKLMVPSTLYDFVQMNLKIWIESAYEAKFISVDNAYIVGDVESQKQDEIIIMDKDTGVEQTSTKWSNGLHQFIQLKHSGKLSNESLKAVYISNVGYFKKYPHLYGMTGTIGGVKERKLLNTVYGINFFEIPRFKTYRFEYDFESELTAGTIEEWSQNIINNIDENMDQQLVYTEEYISSMLKKKQKEEGSLEKITQNYNVYNEKIEKLSQQQVKCQIRIDICDTIKNKTNQIIKMCENPVLETFTKNMKEIIKEINVLKESCTDSDIREIIEKFLGSITEASSRESEYAIQQFSTEIHKIIKKLAISDLNNKQKESHAALSLLIKKNTEERNYIVTAKKMSQKDLNFYQEESQVKPGMKKLDSRRAVLVICDNIADLKYLEDKIKQKFNQSNQYRVYKYDRAYQKFDVSCLEAGDIVVATNIAGRGTDLKVTEQVKENGGLHVILSYMPKNVRIEKQAFGRTARGGYPGTATYIVYDPRKQNEDIDILQLKQEKQELEIDRLANVQKEQLPKINLEDHLFAKFNQLRETMENELRSKRINKKEFLDLQIDSLKNMWAIWLNKMNDSFDKVNEIGVTLISTEYDTFETQVKSKLNNKYGFIEEPGELNKLGRILLDAKQYSEASDCFDYIIEKHPSFSSIALYYKAFCIIHKEGGGFDAKLKAKATLKRSLRMLEDERSRILSRNQILKTINEVARTSGKGLYSDCFSKQNQGEAQILSIHINAINSAIGSEISSDCFNASGIVGDQPQKVFDELLKSQYDIIKNFRVSKKCVVASKVIIKDHEIQKQILEQEKRQLTTLIQSYKNLPKTSKTRIFPNVNLALYDDTIRFITSHNDEYITSLDIKSDKEYQSRKDILNILENTNIISKREIFEKRTANLDSNSKLISFPDVFYYCKEQVLDVLERSLGSSKRDSWYYRKRELHTSAFESMIYTKNKFFEDTKSMIKKEDMIKIADEIKQKLLGQLNHPVFHGKGKPIKRILTNNLVTINHKSLEKKFKIDENESIFFGKKAELHSFCFGRMKITFTDEQSITLLDNQLFLKDDIVKAVKTIVNLSETASFEDKRKFNNLMNYLDFDNHCNLIKKHQLVQLIQVKTELQDKQIEEILTYLEHYTQIMIDHTFIKQRFNDVKNESIFFGKRSEIQEFCLGRKSEVLNSGKGIQLLDNQSFAKTDILEVLKKITNISENVTSTDKTSFDALLIQLGFNVDRKLEAIKTFSEYSFKNESDFEKIREHLEIINLKDSNNDKNSITKIEELPLSVDSRLQKHAKKIIETLMSNLHVNKALKKEDFSLDEDAFNILRAILFDANIINTSIFNLLMDKEKHDNLNPELETILMRMYQVGGIITDQNIELKDEKQASQELFNRLLEAKVIKPPRVNFKLGRGKYVPEFVGGNIWKHSSDPAVRLENIKSQVEQVVKNVFKLERQSDIGHQINMHFTGGIGTESKNKDTDEKIDVITNVIQQVAGTIKTLPEIKVESKDLKLMFSSGNVPAELMDYIQIGFDAVLEYKEHKGFDWDCFLCAMIGMAQIVAGIALEVLSGGSAHYLAQILIMEGVGDIIYAIQSGVEGNFSWKSYGQHKVQSLMISLVTAGIGKFLSKGAEVGKFAVGLATKKAITKAILKSVVLESCTAVLYAGVNVGTEEISNLLMDEIANTHFPQYFDNWTKEDSAHQQKIKMVENKLTELYNIYGIAIAKQNINTCIESSLNKLVSGALGDKIFSQLSNVMGIMARSFSTAARRLGKGNSKAKLLGEIALVIMKTVKLAEFVKNFGQLCNISNEFYDQLLTELNTADKNLSEQRKNGKLEIDEQQIANDKAHYSFSGEVSQDMEMVQNRMHVAFKQKIKHGLLQPAISGLLHMAVIPILDMATAPFKNAMDELKEHIDSRAQKFQIEIMNQNTDKVSAITTRQKKALELRGEIMKIEDIKDPGILKAQVANFEGETLETLQKQHGNNVNIMIRDGKIYAVLPTYKQLCDNIRSGNLKLAGELQIKMAATKSGKSIEIVSPDIDGSKNIIPYEKGPGTVKAINKFESTKESFKVAFIEGEKGKVGHYAPVIKGQDGNWKVIHLNQTAETKDACFGQTMTFLENYDKNRNLNSARTHAENFENVMKYNNTLGTFVKHNDEIKNYYLKGTTVKPDRIVGGINIKNLRPDPESSNPKASILTLYRGDKPGRNIDKADGSIIAKDPNADNTVLSHIIDTKDDTQYISTTTSKTRAKHYANYGDTDGVLHTIEMKVVIDDPKIYWKDNNLVQLGEPKKSIPIKPMSNDFLKTNIIDLTHSGSAKPYRTGTKDIFTRQLNDGATMPLRETNAFFSALRNNEVLIPKKIDRSYITNTEHISFSPKKKS